MLERYSWRIDSIGVRALRIIEIVVKEKQSIILTINFVCVLFMFPKFENEILNDTPSR